MEMMKHHRNDTQNHNVHSHISAQGGAPAQGVPEWERL